MATLQAIRHNLIDRCESNVLKIKKLVDLMEVDMFTKPKVSQEVTQVISVPEMVYIMNGEDIGREIRSKYVTNAVSEVAKHPKIREAVLNKQRGLASRVNASSSLGGKSGLIIDGRDIGTVVLPFADLKIFLIASSKARALRRYLESCKNSISDCQFRKGEAEESDEYKQILQDIIVRDEADVKRKHSPLRKADDAIELDTTNMTLEQQVLKIEELVHQRM
ncbi:hypothetical protein H4219_002348 [Mycoemilia scoparia]|uniref:(d)CMP kinase n=1 Tax=Mycoemilia scoparia TaxID=417184 RepID=A0A9W8A1C2_9FUNG|nr:hypothetical protein H4219_002348 [Mycoemilia scoparia]